MNLGVGVLLVVAALTFLLAAVLQCLSLRKQEDLIERLERLQELQPRWRHDPPARRGAEDVVKSSHVMSRRPG